MWTRLAAVSYLAAVGLLAAVAVPPAPAAAQNLNVRDSAPPSSNAKIGRVLSKARSQSAEKGEAGLNRDTVNTDCSPVEIGNTTQTDDKRRLSRDEQIVVVPGDVINICR